MSEYQKFVTGYCAEYAIALHERFGYPLYVIKGVFPGGDYEIAHAFVSADGGATGLDASGASGVESIKAACFFSRRPRQVKVSRVSRESLEWEVGVEDEALVEARQLVAERGRP